VLTLHLVLLAIGSCALGAAGLRWSGQLAAGLAPRVLGAVSIAVGLAVGEALALGLAGQGASSWWLTAAAVTTFAISRLILPTPTPTVRDQIAERWTQSSVCAQAVVGGLTVSGFGVTAFQLWHPTIGADGLSYHAAQPVVWLSDGHPGSLHQTLANFPTQAYPKTMEVLVEWFYAIARTPLAAVPLALGFAVLAAGSAYVGLRKFGVAPAIAALATAAGLLLPLNMRQTSGVYSDLPALAWLACASALCVISVEEPAVVGLAAIAEGLAIGTKPSTAPLALIGLGWAVWINRRWAASHLRRLVGPGLLAGGLGGVWYVVNWVVYGAPLWPFSRFPSGPPVPPVWRLYTSRFLTEPVTVVRAAGGHPFVVLLAGGLLLLAAVPVTALLALLPANRPLRRTLLAGALLVALDVLLWAGSQFTGLGDAYPLVLITLRYLTPAPLVAAALLAVAAARGGNLLRAVCIAVLVAALALDIWELRGPRLGFPYRPDLAICLALVAIGAVAAVLAARTRWAPAGLRIPGLATGLVLVLGVAMIVPATRFLDHYRATAHQQEFGDAPILAFLAKQPGWVHGSAPVAAGYTAYATLAGPQFAHALSYIPNGEPCASIRAAARRGWVVLEPLGGERHRSLDYLRAPACMAGVAPAATIGKVKVYAPARLLAP
jgi:hypothetical protein